MAGRSPHSGLLAGALQGEIDGRSPNEMQPPGEGHRTQLEAYEGLCRELGAIPAHVALAWLLRNPVVAAAIVGPTTSEELTTSLEALSVRLDSAAVARLDQIWPGPGEAPQAYAW